MIVNNLSNKILLLFNEQGDYQDADYIVEELFFNGCTTGKIVASGKVEDDKVILQLKDGSYSIEVTKPGFAPIGENFIVYYNELPNILEKIQDILCPCDSCKEKDTEILLKDFLYILGYLQDINKLCGPTMFNYILNEKYQEIKNSEEYKKYYGDFKFDYKAAYEDILAKTYIELYYESSNQIVDSDEELNLINSLYNIDFMEKCLYKKGYKASEIICQIEKLDCSCNKPVKEVEPTAPTQ